MVRSSDVKQKVQRLVFETRLVSKNLSIFLKICVSYKYNSTVTVAQ